MAEEEDWRSLPTELQQLLLDLAQNAVPYLPDLDNKEYGGYFRPQEGHGPRDGDGGRHWRVRKRVLTAIANCHSLAHISMFFTWRIGVDREDEVSALLGGLASSPSLESLNVCGEGFGRQAACEALGQLVASSRSLRELSLWKVGLDAAGLGALATGFNKDSVLEDLKLGVDRVGDFEGAQHLAHILATAPRLKILQLRFIGIDVAGAQLIGNALPLCATLRKLVLDDNFVVEDSSPSPSASGLGPLSTVLKLAFTPAHENASISGVTQLDLRLEKDYGEAGLADALAGMLRTNHCIQELKLTSYTFIHGLDGLRHNSTISTLRVWESSPELTSKHQVASTLPSTEVWMQLVPMLQECKALRVLDLRDLRGHASFKKELLRSLKGNAFLNELNISEWDLLNDDMFRDLMKSLQVNRTLREINIWGTTWLWDGKDAIIDAALARNATQQAYLPLLLDGQKPVMPKAGRLFLCGAPFAGKTTLRTTMIRAWKRQTAASPRFEFAQVRLKEKMSRARQWMSSGTQLQARTEGIEIEVLRNDNDMEVTVWDLAGQAEYRAMQDYLFPTYNQACVFLFAFSAVDSQKRHQLHPPKVLQDKFRTSLGFWHRFINSNCRNVGSTLPRIFVVVTHVDQMKASDALELPDLLQPLLTQLATEFKQVVDVQTTPLFFMDARSAKTVNPLLDALMESFRDLFASRLFLVPEVCNRLSAVLTAWVSQNPAQPLVRKQQLRTLFENQLRSFQTGGVQDEGELLGAVLAYLHDVGNIISFQDIDVVVINPHWISHSFLGRLIQLLTTARRASTSSLSHTSDGFVSRNLLHSTLDEILKGTQAHGIGRQNLVSLMTTLKLCYEGDLTRGVGFFVPFTLDDGNGNALHGKRQLTWKAAGATASNYNYLGRRLQCLDKTKTFLGPGFFPRFQVCLRKDLFTRCHGMQPHQYCIERNLINFFFDGMVVFLESSGDIGEDTGDIGDHIDILVRSSKSKDQTVEFVKEHVIAQLKSFCASPEGSPGVELVEGIIRTECMENLTLCIYRHNQSVLTQDLLKYTFADQKDSTGEIFSSLDLADYRWSWPACPEGFLESAFEEAKELLSAVEILDVLQRRRAGLLQTISNIDAALEEVLPTGNMVLAPQDIPVQTSRGVNIRRTKSLFGTTRSEMGEQLLQGIGELKQHLKMVETQVESVGVKVDRIGETLQLIQRESSDIKTWQEDTLQSLLSKMDEIMDFSAELESSQIPRRPYITTADAGLVQRLIAGVRVGKAGKLHFMCESIFGNHIVQGQTGFDLKLEDEKWRWIRPIAINGAKLLVFLAKAGLHAAAGIGGVLPDPATSLDGAVSLAVAFGDSALSDVNLDLTGPAASQNTPVQEAWIALKNLLQPLLRDQMAHKFKLHKVQYRKRNQGVRGVAWVCERCVRRGIQRQVYQPL